MKRALFSTTLLAGLGLSTAAFAQQDGYCSVGFLLADTDGDDAISLQEAGEASGMEYAELDANGDQMITQEEYLACAPVWAAMASTNESSPAAEMNEAFLERTEMADIEFTFVDSDDDGTITQDEFMSWMERTLDSASEPQNVQSTSASGSDDSATAEDEASETDPLLLLRRIVLFPIAPDADPMEMSREEMAARASQQFMYRDSNADQQLDRDEWMGSPEGPDQVTEAMSKRFNTMDADKSGDVSKDEFADESMRSYKAMQAQQEASGGDSTADMPVVLYRYPHPF